jgi:hypothetical protein
VSAIVLAKAMKPGVDAAEVARLAAQPLLDEAPGSWEEVVESPEVAAGMVWRGASPKTGARVASDRDVSVLIDGFLSGGDSAEPAGIGDGRDRHAQRVVEAYRAGGEAALESLQGSFVIVLVDHVRDRVVVLTDKSASRPIYVGQNDSVFLAAPEPKAFHAVPGMCGDILPGSVLSLALNAFLFGEFSYWRNVELLGPARVLVACGGEVSKQRYWKPVFDYRDPPGTGELGVAVRECLVGHLEHFERPALALSGGVDSRVILAVLRRAGLDVDTVTWTYDESEGASADFAVGHRVARAAGFRNEQHRLSNDKLPAQASRIVYASDGLSGFLGAFADREALAERLAGKYDALIFGDQCYRGEWEIHSQADALERVGVRIGPRVSLVRFLMRREAAEASLTDYRRQIESLLGDAEDCPAPHDLHDRLYWQVRVPRLLTGPKALWRMHLEALSPLLDAPMLNLAARLPVERRAHKTYLREGLRDLAPDLARLEFSSVHSRTKWRRIFKESGELPRFIVETLLDPLPAFDEWFDRASIEMWLKTRLVEARTHRASTSQETGHPGLRGGNVLTRLSRRARSLWVNRAFNPRVVINLLTLKLWFGHFGRT